MAFAHVAGLPVEELLPAVLAGGSLMLGRAWFAVRAALARRSD